MNEGERFCLFEKKARRFKKSDAKSRVPKWCPKRTSPSIIRIYGFKSSLDEMICIDLSRDGNTYYPSEHSYKLRNTGTTALTAAAYYEAGVYQDNLTPLPHEVVEIDNGVCSAFFYRNGESFKYLPFFDKAKLSQRGDSDAGD